MKTAERQYIEAFEDELRSFLLRVQQRAQVRIENAMKEAEEVREAHALMVMYTCCIHNIVSVLTLK